MAMQDVADLVTRKRLGNICLIVGIVTVLVCVAWVVHGHMGRAAEIAHIESEASGLSTRLEDARSHASAMNERLDASSSDMPSVATCAGRVASWQNSAPDADKYKSTANTTDTAITEADVAAMCADDATKAALTKKWSRSGASASAVWRSCCTEMPDSGHVRVTWALVDDSLLVGTEMSDDMWASTVRVAWADFDVKTMKFSNFTETNETAVGGVAQSSTS